MDINPRHLGTTSLLSDHFAQVPVSTSIEFPRCVQEIIERYEVDTYLPLIPKEIEIAARMRDDGRVPANISVMAPPLRASAVCADKLSLVEVLRARSIPIPITALASEPFSAVEFFLKPREGVGSRGARSVMATELETLLGGAAENWIVQEPCLAPEVTVDAFHCRESGVCKTVCRERIEVKSGVSTKCRLFPDATLDRYAREIAAALEIQGSFCFQVMRNSSGWVVTDVNPRPGAGTAMCNVTGNDFFAASFARCWGENVERFFKPLDGERFVTRQYAEFSMGPHA
jgi:carbamoylphosphate synthase large subunit